MLDKYIEIAFGSEKPDGWVVDVGANDGTFQSWSLPLERSGWKVLCIEGNPEYEEKLSSRKHYMIAAVSDKEGPAEYYIFNRPQSYSGLIKHPGVDFHKVIQVDTRTLTSCLKERGINDVALLGLDIEGGECAALHGFDFTLWQPKLILVEKHFSQFTTIPEFLADLGYTKLGTSGLDEVFICAEHSSPAAAAKTGHS
jgi:FkbM family methyltransferase